MSNQNKEHIPVYVGYMLHIWCDTYYEPDGYIWFLYPHRPKIGDKVISPTGKHEEYTVEYVDESSMEIKAK